MSGLKLEKCVSTPSGIFDLGSEEVQAADDGAVTLQHEGAVVELALAAEALREPSGPGPLLARGLVVGEGHDVLEAREGPETLGRQQPGPEQDVLVGEGQQGPAVLVAP